MRMSYRKNVPKIDKLRPAGCCLSWHWKLCGGTEAAGLLCYLIDAHKQLGRLGRAPVIDFPWHYMARAVFGKPSLGKLKRWLWWLESHEFIAITGRDNTPAKFITVNFARLQRWIDRNMKGESAYGH